MNTREYYATRKSYLPKVGEVLENNGGFSVVVLPSICNGIAEGRAHAVVKNTRSGWVCTAHGIGIYEDGRVDWDGSTDGYFDSDDEEVCRHDREYTIRHTVADAVANVERLLPLVHNTAALLPLAGLYPGYVAGLLRDWVEGYENTREGREVLRAADILADKANY